MVCGVVGGFRQTFLKNYTDLPIRNLARGLDGSVVPQDALVGFYGPNNRKIDDLDSFSWMLALDL